MGIEQSRIDIIIRLISFHFTNLVKHFVTTTKKRVTGHSLNIEFCDLTSATGGTNVFFVNGFTHFKESLPTFPCRFVLFYCGKY